MSDRERPTYATRLLQPFAEVLEDYGPFSNLGAEFEGLGERVLVEVAHRALAIAVEHTKDPDVGLKAARRLVLGDVGAVDYVVSSAPRVREALEQASRYMRLINDVLSVRLEIDGRFANVRLDNSVVMPRAAVDFEVGGFFRNHVCEWLRTSLPELSVCFNHQAPANLVEYERTFSPSRVEFNAAFLGFRFDQRLLDLPLEGADANLQAVMLPYANQTLERLVPTRSVTAQVRKMVVESFAAGNPDIVGIASKLGMSVRTLARRLDGEGTSFRDVTDDARKQMALDYVGGRDTDLSEVAFALGFSHVAAFHRAFRRWTGTTPLLYRRASGR